MAETVPAVTPPVTPEWTSSLNDDLKGYVGTKGFKDPGAVVDAYRNLEKLHGVPADKIMKLPEKFYDDSGKLTPEGRTVYERLGAPKEKTAYEIEKLLPKSDKVFVEKMTDAFHEAGVPKWQAEKIIKQYADSEKSMSESQSLQAQNRLASEQADLKKDWGSGYDANMLKAKEGAIRLGHTEAQINALVAAQGFKGAMKLYHQMGTAVGESAFITGQRPVDVIAPETAMTKIANLRSDKDWSARYLKGDSQAKAEMETLMKVAYPGELNVG